MSFENIAKAAKIASLQMAEIQNKNEALTAMADAIEKNIKLIFQSNDEDLKNAKVLVEKGELSQATFNRLKLDENKMKTMIQGIRDVVKLEDPVNKKLMIRELDKDLTLYKVTCPIGVLGIIFEARPDVIAQICSLAIKSSNAVILKGGKEAINTNKTILNVINTALNKIENFPKNVLQQIYTHEDVSEMLKCDKYINLIIPRGSNSLVKFIKENTKIAVLGHADGICHIFVDEKADLSMAEKVVTDAKCQYPSACNSVETLLVHKNFAESEKLLASLQLSEVKLIDNPERWDFEYGDKILAIKYVSSIEEAISHINKYGSGHTDCIITNDVQNAELFMNKVDSAGVYMNASTRFADGFRYGFGAEVGISTNKTHARGPVGLEGLVIYKYKLYGNGQIVEDYANGNLEFHHKDLL